ncbi:MAG: hypothetical protein ACK42Y_06810 [Candidatus Thermochlorobacter sp.]
MHNFRADAKTWCACVLGILLLLLSSTTKAQSLDTLVVLYTGGAYGYLEACPCSKENLGGLARRFSVVNQTRATFGEKVVLVDAGNQFSAYPKSTAEAMLITKLMSQMRYDACNLAENDFTYGAHFTRTAFAELPTVSANLCDTAGVALTVPYRLVQAGEWRVGILGLLTESALSSATETAQQEVKLIAPLNALSHALDSLSREEPDIIILLLRTQDIDYEKFLAEKFPQLSVIVSNSEDLISDTPKQFGRCLALSAGHDGEYIGRLMLIFKGRQRVAVHNERIALSPKIASDKSAQEMIQAFKHAQKRKPKP